MKIALGLCYYEDLQGIQRLFDSLEKTNANVYRIFAIDGKYKQFSDSPSFLSSPKVHHYLEQFPKVVNYTEWTTFPTEIEKRNKYLELCNDDIDFLIVVDSDEYFTGDWDLFVTNLEKLKERIYKENVHLQMRNLHFIAMQTDHVYYINRQRYGILAVITPGFTQTQKTPVYTQTIRQEYEENMHRYQIEQKKIEDNNLIYTPLPK